MHQQKLLIILCIFTSLFAICQAEPLWGVAGHALTAQIAQFYLNPGALLEVDYFLANESGQMYLVASWADQVLKEPQWAWSAPLHYINTPDWSCTYVSGQTDCPNHMCVADAIFNYTAQLSTRFMSYNSHEISIRFVIHFHGDIHQPLHVGFISDKGGNLINGTYYGNATNLHAIWDDGLIATRIDTEFEGSQALYLEYLLSQINGTWKELAEVWATCNSTSELSSYACPDQWARESAEVACKYAYTDQDGQHIENGFALAEPYYNFAKETLDQQLIKGGVRLASTLNKMWKTRESMNEKK